MNQVLATLIPAAGTVEDILVAAKKMQGSQRRSFLAEMTLKYCQGNARKAETVFGWSRKTVETGLGEQRTGITCMGAQRWHSGKKRWEERSPEVAKALVQLAESHCQQDPSFQTPIAYTRLTAKEALQQLAQQGFEAEHLPSPNAMRDILNRLGYRLRKVVKAKPQKKSKKPMPSSLTSKPKMNKPKQPR